MFGFMTGQCGRLREVGFAPTVVSAPSSWLDERAVAESARRLELPICREISLFKDIVSFIRLCDLFRREEPEGVLLSGPKAIFLGGMAAWICGVPTRVAVYHGMRQERLRGPLRWLLDLCDRVSFACAGQVLAVSPSLRELMLARKLAAIDKVGVIGHGTANGVNPERFALSRGGILAAKQLKLSLAIPPVAPVIGFVGRLTEDKGVADAYAAYQALLATHPDLHLVLLGVDEMHTKQGRELLVRLRSDPQVRIAEHSERIEDYLHLFWAQVFPSSREGFGMVIAEAAALAVPTVAYDVTGVRDAIADGETGMLVPHGDTAALAKALSLYLNSPELRRRHGEAGWRRVRSLFTPEHTWPSYLQALGLPAAGACPKCPPTISPAEASALAEREQVLR
jgi:glycosyltransferase involved in cell wall biosynthesis